MLETALREATILRQIACSPVNGIAWAELAELRQGKVSKDELQRYITLSHSYAPHEAEAIEARMRLIVSDHAGLDDHMVEIAHQDMAAILTYASPDKVAATLEGLAGDLRSWSEAAVLRLPDTRRQAIERAASTAAGSD